MAPNSTPGISVTLGKSFKSQVAQLLYLAMNYSYWKCGWREQPFLCITHPRQRICVWCSFPARKVLFQVQKLPLERRVAAMKWVCKGSFPFISARGKTSLSPPYNTPPHPTPPLPFWSLPGWAAVERRRARSKRPPVSLPEVGAMSLALWGHVLIVTYTTCSFTISAKSWTYLQVPFIGLL